MNKKPIFNSYYGDNKTIEKSINQLYNRVSSFEETLNTIDSLYDKNIKLSKLFNILYNNSKYINNNYILDIYYNNIIIDTSSNNITITLPKITDNDIKGLTYYLKKISASNTVTLEPNGSEMIDGASDYTLSSNYESVTIIAGADNNWYIY